MPKIQSLRHWLPCAFCALLVYIEQRNTDRVSASQYILIWMPMCFFYVGAVTFLMQKQIRELQAELKELRSGAVKLHHET